MTQLSTLVEIQRFEALSFSKKTEAWIHFLFVSTDAFRFPFCPDYHSNEGFVSQSEGVYTNEPLAGIIHSVAKQHLASGVLPIWVLAQQNDASTDTLRLCFHHVVLVCSLAAVICFMRSPNNICLLK